MGMNSADHLKNFAILPINAEEADSQIACRQGEATAFSRE
jgi:hypothetical protein